MESQTTSGPVQPIEPSSAKDIALTVLKLLTIALTIYAIWVLSTISTALS